MVEMHQLWWCYPMSCDHTTLRSTFLPPHTLTPCLLLFFSPLISLFALSLFPLRVSHKHNYKSS